MRQLYETLVTNFDILHVNFEFGLECESPDSLDISKYLIAGTIICLIIAATSDWPSYSVVRSFGVCEPENLKKS